MCFFERLLLLIDCRDETLKKVVHLEWSPTNSKKQDDHGQHLDDLLREITNISISGSLSPCRAGLWSLD
jgi:hypothetical protein